MAEQPRPGEQGKVEQMEILDLENHIGLYGRLFLASQAKTEEEVTNIINPATQVLFQLDVDKVSLDKRDYNPVFKNLSFKERQDEWRGTPYDEAKRKWQEQFTESIHTIKKGSNRELALKAILPGKNAATFNEDEADDLFNKFCDGKSDVHKFTSIVVSNLPSDKRNSYDLKGLIPDLQWIASGLFGNQTAGMVANLVHLESLLDNDHAEILDILNRHPSKEKIRKPQDNEFRVLEALYNLIPEAERGLAQVATVTTSAPPAAVLKPDPFPESDEDEDEVGSPPSPPPPPSTQERSEDTATRIQNLLSQLNTLEKSSTNIGEHTKRYIDDQKKAINEQIKGLKRIDELKIQIGNLEKIDTSKFGKHTIQNKSLQEEKLKRELAHLQAKYAPPPEIVPKAEEGLINAQPQPAKRPVVPEVKDGEEEPIPGFVVTPIEGSDKFQIKINGKDTGFKWGKAYGTETEYRAMLDLGDSLINADKFPELLDLPEGSAMSLQVGKYDTEDRQRYGATDNKLRMFRIIAGQNTEVPLSRNVYGIWLHTEIPNDMPALKPGELYEWDKEEPIALDDFRKLLNPQTPVQSDLVTETEPLAKIEATPIPENIYRYVTLAIDGYDSGCAWDQRIDASKQVEGNFFMRDISNAKGPLRIPNGIILEVRYDRRTRGAAFIKGGNTEISISDLKYLFGKGISLEIYLDNGRGSSIDVDQLERGKAKFGDYIGSAGEVIARLKEVLEPSVIGEAKPGSSPGQAEFDLNNLFTGTDDDFRRGMESLGAKLE